MEAGARRDSPLPFEIANLERAIRRLPPGPLGPADVRVPDFQLFADWDIACHYAPLDHVEALAAVVVVGLNPGGAQAATAHAAARDALWRGARWTEALCEAKRAAGLGGPALTNLARMLDEVGLPAVLAGAGICEVASSRELLAPGRAEVHWTNCVRYPVAVNTRDYTGRRPQLLRDQRLRAFVFDVLAPELGSLPDALVIPLGRVAGEAMEALVVAGLLEPARCLFGLPHPSGANGHREADFKRARRLLSTELRQWLLRRRAQPASLESP